MGDRERRLEARLHQQIPLTRAIGIEVVRYSGSSLVLRAPLAPNVNHEQTVFGGSLYAVAVLAGWGLTVLVLEDQQLDGHIVIQHSDIAYLHPVESDFEACSTLPDPEELDQFLKMLTRKGRGRLRLQTLIGLADDPAVSFTGSFVVQR